jgi:ABC-type sulfate transport system permease subunit
MATISEVNEILLKLLYLLSFVLIFLSSVIFLVRLTRLFMESTRNGFQDFTRMVLKSDAIRSWWFAVLCISLLAFEFLGRYLGR